MAFLFGRSMVPPRISLSEMPTLTLLYSTGRLSSAATTQTNASSIFNDKISLIRANITYFCTDAIVNAANESLLGGGGVDGAIHANAGPGLREECKMLGGCDTGDAKVTGAHRLPCKKIIHAVGPVYASAKLEGNHTQLLQRCYTKSLDLAVKNDCKSIAFSALSTGVYGYPSDEAAEAAISAVKAWLDADEERSGKIERIVFCSFTEKDEKTYEEIIPHFFPPGPESVKNDAEDKEMSLEESTETPKLPDVPTAEPDDDELPGAKRRKLSGDDENTGAKEQ